MDKRALSRTGDAGYAAENAEWNIDVEILKIVVPNAAQLSAFVSPAAAHRHRDDFPPERYSAVSEETGAGNFEIRPPGH